MQIKSNTAFGDRKSNHPSPDIVSDESIFATGQVFAVDGGMTI